jgi:hypothetical protein
MSAGGSTALTCFNVARLFTSSVSNHAVTTLLSDWYVRNIAAAGATINGANIYCTGSCSVTTATMKGSSNIYLIGSGAVTSTADIRNNLIINTNGTYSIGSFIYNGSTGGSTITYTAGNIITSGTLTLNGPGIINMNTEGISWNNITLSSSSFTLNLGNTLNVLGRISFQDQNYTFGGSAGFVAERLHWNNFTPGVTSTGIVLSSGLTYTVSSSLILYSITRGKYLGIKSTNPGSQAYLNLAQGATQQLGNIEVTDINSSNGQTLWIFSGGGASNSPNWLEYSSLLSQKTTVTIK